MPNYGQHTSSNYKERFDSKQRTRLARLWERSDGFAKVGVIRNGNDIGEYEIHMFNLGIEGKTVMEFVAHPLQPIERGDILIDGRDNIKYLVWRHDKHKNVNDFGKLQPMFNVIKYRKGQEVVSIPYFIESYGIGTQDPTERIPLPSNRKMLWCQGNNDSKAVRVNQRFLLGTQPFKCKYIDDFSNPNILVFTMEADQKHPLDDIDEGIAYNDDIEDVPIEQEGDTIFSKTSLSIRLNQSDSVEVYRYVEDLPQADTFTFRIDGMLASEYQIISSTDNSVTIKALSSGRSGLLVAINTLSDEETTIPIEFRGLF